MPLLDDEVIGGLFDDVEDMRRHHGTLLGGRTQKSSKPANKNSASWLWEHGLQTLTRARSVAPQSQSQWAPTNACSQISWHGPFECSAASQRQDVVIQGHVFVLSGPRSGAEATRPLFPWKRRSFRNMLRSVGCGQAKHLGG